MLFVDRKPNAPLRARAQMSERTPANRLYVECLNDALGLGLFQMFTAADLKGYPHDVVEQVLDELVDAGGLVYLPAMGGTPAQYVRPHRRGQVLHELIPPPSLDRAAAAIWDKESKLQCTTPVEEHVDDLCRALINIIRQPFSDIMLARAFYVLVTLAGVARYDLAEAVEFFLNVYGDFDEASPLPYPLLQYDPELQALACQVCGLPMAPPHDVDSSTADLGGGDAAAVGPTSVPSRGAPPVSIEPISAVST